MTIPGSATVLNTIGAQQLVANYLGDSYDNALADSTIGLYKTELIERRGSWRSLEEVELATLGWVDWYNRRRLHSACGNTPPKLTSAVASEPARL